MIFSSISSCFDLDDAETKAFFLLGGLARYSLYDCCGLGTCREKEENE